MTTTELETRSRRRGKEETPARLEIAGPLRGPALEAAGDEKSASSSEANWALLGPLWAAYGGWWGMFLISAALELIGLVLLGFGYSMSVPATCGRCCCSALAALCWWAYGWRCAGSRRAPALIVRHRRIPGSCAAHWRPQSSPSPIH